MSQADPEAKIVLSLQPVECAELQISRVGPRSSPLGSCSPHCACGAVYVT